jgi:hypothetical protein
MCFLRLEYYIFFSFLSFGGKRKEQRKTSQKSNLLDLLSHKPTLLGPQIQRVRTFAFGELALPDYQNN